VRFTETPLAGAYVIDLERRGDARGFFARTFCAREFAEHGLATHFVQGNMSLSATPGTLRGLHYQHRPRRRDEADALRPGRDVGRDRGCASGIPHLSAGLRHCELSPGNGRALYVPKGFAHGFQTLGPDTIAFYMVDAFYTPGVEDGFRFDDPALGLDWPMDVTEISDKDRTWPLIGTKGNYFKMMMILDTALKKRAAEGNPIRVGMVGVGFIGRARPRNWSTRCRA
jgi:dTDP-4-dehydrorhamnose 3,5-epimerase